MQRTCHTPYSLPTSPYDAVVPPGLEGQAPVETRVDPVPPPRLIHHLGVFASDFAASESFYSRALAALGVEAGYRTDSIAEYWIPEHDAPSLSLEAARSEVEVTHGLHLAFEAADRDAVHAFHEAAVSAGGTSRHEPKYWPEYRAYAAFVSDPDGNNVEALVKDAKPA